MFINYCCSEEQRTVQWLKPGDPAHKVLIDYLSSNHFLNQIAQAAHGSHTGSLESLHSMMLAYAPKRLDFDPRSYEGRIKLAIMDHNENVQRALKLGKNLLCIHCFDFSYYCY